MRRPYTIGAPSVFVNKNGLGRFPQFRDQGVGGSNPLSPTKIFNVYAGSREVVSEARFLCLCRATSLLPQVEEYPGSCNTRKRKLDAGFHARESSELWE